jgi:hypothetical protein
MNMRRWLITLSVCLLVLAALAGIKYQQIRAAIALGESFPEPSASVEAHVAGAWQRVTSPSSRSSPRNPWSCATSSRARQRGQHGAGSRVRQGDTAAVDIRGGARLKRPQRQCALAALNRTDW